MGQPAAVGAASSCPRKFHLTCDITQLDVWHAILLLARCHLLLAMCHLLLARCHLLLARCHLLLARCHLLLARCHLLLARCHLLLARCHLLLARCHLGDIYTNMGVKWTWLSAMHLATGSGESWGLLFRIWEYGFVR